VSEKMSSVIEQNQDILDSILDLERENDKTRAKIKNMRQRNLEMEREKDAARRASAAENSDFDAQIKALETKQQALMDANQALSDKCSELESMNESEQQELEDIEQVFATEKERVCKEIRKLQTESPSSRFKRGVSRIIMSIRDDTSHEQMLRTAVQHGHEHHHNDDAVAHAKESASVDESDVEQEELEELENVFEAEKDKMCREIRKLQADSPDAKSKRDVSRIINKIKQDHSYEAPLRSAVHHGHEHHHSEDDVLGDKGVRSRAVTRMKEVRELEKAMRVVIDHHQKLAAKYC